MRLSVPYKPQVHDGPPTMEQQTLLLASAAKRAWELWCSTSPQPLQGVSSEFDSAMRELYQRIYCTDLFMGGVAEGRGKEDPAR